MGAARRAVYSVLLGDYENLREQPVAASSQLPFIMLTDNPELRSSTWDVRVIDPSYPLDLVRSARAAKILGAADLGGCSETLWIDNRVELTVPPEEILDEWLSSVDLAVPFHSFREELLDEFFAVVVSGFDDPTRVYEQLIHYGETRPDALGARPLWTGMMARRAAPEVAATMRSWMDHVLRYSRRDQLSLPYVLSSSPVRWRGIELDNQTSRWHRWPPVGEDLDRRTDARHVRFEHTIQAPLSRLRELERAAAGVGRLGAGALDGPGGAEGSALGEGTAAIETLGTGELLSALEDASLELTTVREELASAEAERDEAVARCDREHSVWERLVAERDQAEEAAIVAVRELEAAVARRDRAEANVEALHQTVAKVRREKREAVQNLKAKATRARTQTAQAKAELTRLKKSRAYKLARHAGGAMRALRGRRA